MRAFAGVALLLAALTLTAAAGASAAPAGPAAVTHAAATASADALYNKAGKAQGANLFTRATELYGRARQLYLAAGDAGRARVCLTDMQDIKAVALSYPCTRAEMLDLLAAHYPASTAAQREAWLDLPSTESLRWDGETHYFSDLPRNLSYRDVGLFQTQPALVDAYQGLYDVLKQYITVAATMPAWRQYGEPHAWHFTQTLSVPRDKLPASGDLDVWFPLPIETGPQTGVNVTGLTPTGFVRNPPSFSQDIGLLAMSVPLQALNGDLAVTFDVSFNHAAQYFKVDPARVGTYDTADPEYIQYTASRANTRITPSIRRTARRVAGGEKNPYLAAKRLYDYVLRTVKYSFMPHAALYPRGVAESVYVHEHRCGDCGAQSMYFSALCRSVGIPARTTGGFQIFSGTPSSHFWAEFYLPNYGWVPADPTAATLVDYVPGISAADRAAFHDFFFSNQDDLRLTVQKDTDIPFIPRAGSRVLMPLCVQNPAALCDTMTDFAESAVWDYWTFK